MMDRPCITSTLLFSALAVSGAPRVAIAQAVPAPNRPMAVYQLPEAKRVKLPNGLIVLLLEKHELPLISAELAFRSGSIADPAGKAGLSSLTAALLREGTTNRSADQISADADFIGMTLNSTSSLETTNVSGDFLKKDTAKALGLMSEIALHPTFPDAQVKKAVAKRQDQLRSAKDNPQQVLGPYFQRALYGDHPYGRPTLGDLSSIPTISREDVVAFHGKNYTPGNAVLAVVGDFDATAMEATLKQLFGGWTGPVPSPIPVPALKPVTGKHVVLVDKPDATQSYFVIGNVGLSDTSPDRAPVEIVNTLFGGRFTSMFNDELRIKSGYSYGANSRFIELHTPGPFEMLTFTKNTTTEPAIDKSLEVLARLHSHPFTEADLTSAKNYIGGTFPPSLETTPALAHQLTQLETRGITRAQFNAELQKEQATTLADTNRVIDADFFSDNYVMVLIGKASEIGKIAAKYGSVTTRSISDPTY